MSMFHGLSAFPLTPTDASGRVDERALASLIARIQASGANSIGLLGSTGVYTFLSREERRRAVEAAVAVAGGKTPIIVGVGALRTADAVALADDARKDGADGLLLAPVSYTPLTQDEVFEHFVAVAEAAQLPLCIYNNPSTTAFTFGDALIARLSRVANIAAIKMPLPADSDFAGELKRIRAITADGFSIGYSGDWGAKAALLAECDAWYSVVAGLLPVPALALTRAAQAGDDDEAERLDRAFHPLWKLFKRFGSLRVMYDMAAALNLGDFEPPRPLMRPPPAEMVGLKEVLHSLEVIALSNGKRLDS